MTRIVGDCRFCGTTGVVINDEHAFPVWSIKLVRAQRHSDAKFVMREQGRGAIPEHMTRVPELIVNGPCRDICNNGWMRDLENRVRSFLADMLTSGQLTFLDHAKAMTLALWTVKTAMVFEFRSNMRESVYFTDAERVGLRNGSLPVTQTLRVWIARYIGPRPYTFCRVPLNYPGNNPPLHGCTFTMSLGQVFLQVLAYRAGNESATRNGPWDRLIRLFPTDSPDPAVWPPPAKHLEDEEVELAAVRFTPASIDPKMLNGLG
jgi:hypothetical protein